MGVKQRVGAVIFISNHQHSMALDSIHQALAKLSTEFEQKRFQSLGNE